MTAFAHAVLITLLHLPVYDGDKAETIEARTELLTPVAEVIAEVSGEDEEMAAALEAIAWSETKLARYVIEGRCEDGPPDARCDPDKHGIAHARGAWQVQGWCAAAWNNPAASRASLVGGAKCAVRMLTFASSHCGKDGGNQWVAAFAGYRSAKCQPLDSADRVKTMVAVQLDLARARKTARRE